LAEDFRRFKLHGHASNVALFDILRLPGKFTRLRDNLA
jgi:hypothetical protein